MTSTNRWPEQIRLEQQAKYGSHGTGLVPLLYNMSLQTRVNSEFWTIAGSWEAGGALGPAQTRNIVGSGTVLMHEEAVATFTATFDHLNVYCYSDASSGTLNVSIDGGSAIPACETPSTAAKAQVMTTPTLALGAHAAQLSCLGTCHLYGAEGAVGSSGVSIHNLSIGSCAAECFGSDTADELAFVSLIPGGVQQTVIALLTNESGIGYPPATFGQSLQHILDSQTALGSKVLLVVPPVSNLGTATSTFPAYTAAELAVAATNALPVANIQSLWGLSFNAANGYWSPDQIHPNDAGSLAEFRIIDPYIAASQ